MRAPSRALTLTSRTALLVTLLALSVFLAVRATLDSQDTFEKQAPITQVVAKGQTGTVEDVVWRLDKMELFTRLVDKDKQPIDVKVPDGAIIVKTRLTLTVTDRTRLGDGFACNAQLRDDRGNVWEDDDAFGVELPTFCGDDDLKIVRGKPFQILKIYVIPKSAVPHIVGLITPGTDDKSAEQRLLLKA